MRPRTASSDAGQRVDAGRGAVELAAAMVGDDQPVDAVVERGLGLGRVEDALEEERPLPDAAELVDVGPGHRRVEERGHAAGERLEVGGLAGADDSCRR